jgi:predicted TIM-barrel fold metal-dependent hydrolase
MDPIDIHSHLFNLKYLPVAGIIVRYGDGKISWQVARAIEWYFVRTTASDFEAQATLGPLSVRDAPIVKRADVHRAGLGIMEKRPTHHNQLFSMSNRELITLATMELTESHLDAPEIRQALIEHIQTEKLPAGKKRAFVQSLITETRTPQDLVDALDKFRGLLASVFKKIRMGYSYLRWFLFMRNSELNLFASLQQDASVGRIRVSKFLYMMMDVDYFFNKPGENTYKSNFDFVDRQIANFEALNTQLGDKVIGFVAFNPARVDGLDIVQRALGAGFRGVKFYPPMGYKAMGNTEPFESRIMGLFDHCVQNDIPVFTHCNNAGFEAYPGQSGINSSPVHWDKLLQIPKYRNLRVCFGHAGGGEGWFAKNQDTDFVLAADVDASLIKDSSKEQAANWNHSYAALVFKLCVTYPNVYCDASYLDEMVRPSGFLNKTEAKKFKIRLDKLFQSDPDFSRKIMYGSDWHMLMKDAKNAVYFSTYLDFFNAPASDGMPSLQQYSERFFEKNARDFLKI